MTQPNFYSIALPASFVVGCACAQITSVRKVLAHPVTMGCSALAFLWGGVRLVRGDDFILSAKILAVALYILGANIVEVLAEGA